MSLYESILLTRSSSPSNTWKDNLQASINYSFDNSSSFNTIEEEATFGTQLYDSIDVRIVHIVNSSTGAKVGDDWKELIFKNMEHPKGMGHRYSFDENIWLTVNADLYKYVTASTVVRRCNNTWKYVDVDGKIVEEPCVIDYVFTSTNFDYDEAVITPKGDLFVALQANSASKKIKINDRVVFDGQAFKVTAINTFGRLKTFDSSSTAILYFDITKDAVANDDDLINNIANTTRYSSVVVVGGSDVVTITPTDLSILKGNSQTYSVYRYLNNVQQSDTFVFSANGEVGTYSFVTVNGNSFTITNLNKSVTPLVVTCVSGLITETFSIQLKGAW
jgi:hypothetical protein